MDRLKPYLKIDMYVNIFIMLVLLFLYSNSHASESSFTDITENEQTLIESAKEAVSQGDEETLYKLGKIYQLGEGVPQDNLKAFRYFQTALLLELGHDFGGASLNVINAVKKISNKLTLPQINKEKIDIHKQLGEENVHYAPSELAFDYWIYAETLRENEDPNYMRSSASDRIAIQLGSKEAQRFLVNVFQQGNPFFGREDGRAFNYYKKSAGQEESEHQLSLAYMHFHGKQTPQDKPKALHWYKQATQQKTGEKHKGFNTIAMYLVAWMYDTGQGIPQDDQAFKWYQKAAVLDYGDAQLRLAEMYQLGQGVEKNKEKAIDWYQIAAEQGYHKAQRVLAHLYRTGTLFEQDKKQAFAWYKKAAVLEDLEAQYALAEMYATGEGVNKNPTRAYLFSNYLAQQYSHVDAQKLSEKLTKEMTETQLTQSKKWGEQWLHDAKYRTLGVAVEPPFEW